MTAGKLFPQPWRDASCQRVATRPEARGAIRDSQKAILTFPQPAPEAIQTSRPREQLWFARCCLFARQANATPHTTALFIPVANTSSKKQKSRKNHENALAVSV